MLRGQVPPGYGAVDSAEDRLSAGIVSVFDRAPKTHPRR
jgi:hypothetical protein